MKKNYHSKDKKAKVYHNTTKCTEGNNIERKNVTSGKGGRKLCKHCNKINKK